jgi:hypothetical protein
LPWALIEADPRKSYESVYYLLALWRDLHVQLCLGAEADYVGVRRRLSKAQRMEARGTALDLCLQAGQPLSLLSSRLKAAKEATWLAAAARGNGATQALINATRRLLTCLVRSGHLVAAVEVVWKETQPLDPPEDADGVAAVLLGALAVCTGAVEEPSLLDGQGAPPPPFDRLFARIGEAFRALAKSPLFLLHLRRVGIERIRGRACEIEQSLFGEAGVPRRARHSAEQAFDTIQGELQHEFVQAVLARLPLLRWGADTQSPSDTEEEDVDELVARGVLLIRRHPEWTSLSQVALALGCSRSRLYLPKFQPIQTAWRLQHGGEPGDWNVRGRKGKDGSLEASGP